MSGINSPTKRLASHLRHCSGGGFIFLGFILLFLTGCENSYQVKVDGIRDNRMIYPQGTPYAVLLPPRGATGLDFDREKAEAMVKTSLATRGYYPVDNVNEAEIVITVEYGLTAGRVSFKQRRSIMPPVIGTYDPGYQTYPGIIPVLPPTKDELVSEVVKTKYITFSARDPDKIDRNGKPIEVWNLVVKIEDEGDDLDEYMPVLLAAAMNYLGEDTGEQLELTLGPDSEAVQYVINDATFEKPVY